MYTKLQTDKPTCIQTHKTINPQVYLRANGHVYK
jgi:hypothetical protein